MINDNEKVYDEEIAPLLLKVRDLCEKHGLPMTAAVQFNETDYGSTSFCPTRHYPLANMRQAYYFIKSRNFDASMGAVLEDAKRFGHSSIYLKILGIEPGPGTDNKPAAGVPGFLPSPPAAGG